jgi:hypothetical protein
MPAWFRRFGTSTGGGILCAWHAGGADLHRGARHRDGTVPNASRALAFGRRCGRGPLAVVAPCRKGRELVDAPASSASAAATLRRQRRTGRSRRWADPVDGRVHEAARLCLSGVTMLGLPTARREAARAASPCDRDLLGAFRPQALRGRPFRHSGDTAAEWTKVPGTDGTNRDRIAKRSGATRRPRS